MCDRISWNTINYYPGLYQLPFNPQIHKPTSDYQYPVPHDPDPLKSDPAVSMLRFYWNIAWHESLDKLCGMEGIYGTPTKANKYCEDLVWRDIDSQILRCSHVQAWLTKNLSSISKATSHYPAKLAMTRVHASLVGDLGVAARGTKMVVEKLYTMHWQEALERYLLVLPNSIEDDELLIEVLSILSSMLTSPSQPPMSVVAWIARITVQSDGPLLALLRTTVGQTAAGSSKAATELRRTLRKSTLQFYGFLVRRLLHTTQPWRCDGERVVIGELVHAVTLNLDLADNPSYYDLPVLESALECIGHVTGRSQWSAYSKSQDALGLCTSMLASLVQVVSAFHAGRLGSSTSFMGKGVTYHASLCLVHLVQEMNIIDPTKVWVCHWVPRDDTDSQPLAWLVTLWSDRSPEVRWMGLSIATSLARTIEGHVSLTEALQGVAGGVIGTALPLMLDDGECGMVRQQATLLLCSLVTNLIVDESLHPGTSQTESDNRASLPEISTLRALLDHFKFYTRLQAILTSFSTRAVSFKAASSRACQSSASVSVSTLSSNIPYQHLQSSSQSVSLVSDTAHNASQTQSPVSNGMRSPGDQSTVTLSNGSAASSNASVQTQESQMANSRVPLLNERGLPSGMSTTSSSANTYVPSVAGSMASQATPMTSSLTPAYVGALAQFVQALVAVDPTYTITAIKQDNILHVFWSWRMR
ncbi:hypothetical protein QZH41_017664 [Actinostola sp. cb2023]|nr:hypothetical protein QZH41_017664 [Actinostola sp. cb2023]